MRKYPTRCLTFQTGWRRIFRSQSIVYQISLLSCINELSQWNMFPAFASRNLIWRKKMPARVLKPIWWNSALKLTPGGEFVIKVSIILTLNVEYCKIISSINMCRVIGRTHESKKKYYVGPWFSLEKNFALI